MTTVVITVNPLPNAIAGSNAVCEGGTISLTETTTSGTWTSSNIAVATINSSGMATGVVAGTDTISYSVTNSCRTAQSTITGTIAHSVTDAVTGGTIEQRYRVVLA